MRYLTGIIKDQLGYKPITIKEVVNFLHLNIYTGKLVPEMS